MEKFGNFEKPSAKKDRPARERHLIDDLDEKNMPKYIEQMRERLNRYLRPFEHPEKNFGGKLERNYFEKLNLTNDLSKAINILHLSGYLPEKEAKIWLNSLVESGGEDNLMTLNLLDSIIKRFKTKEIGEYPDKDQALKKKK